MTQIAQPSVILKGIGSYTPEKILTNDDLSKIVETSDEWIVSRTGIRERRIAAEDESCSDIGVQAALKALDHAGMEAQEIDMILVATITPDMLFPSTACLIQKKLGLQNIPCLDLEAACTGFVYALDIGTSLLKSNRRLRNILIVGSEKLSSFIDWEDRSTCVLFGDGAGAAVLTRSEVAGEGVLDTLLGADGSNPELLNLPAGGTQLPTSAETLAQKQHFLKMNGREVFKFASRAMVQASNDILLRNNLTVSDVDIIIPHQANIRIIENACKSMGVPMDQFFINLDHYGNTSAASVPIALDEAYRAGRIQPGDLVLCVAFGAGLTWGSALLKWHRSW